MRSLSHKQYRQMREKIEADYRNELSALEMMWKKFGDRSSAPSTTRSKSESYGKLTETVLELGQAHGGDFTIKNLFEKAKAIFPSLRYNSVATSVKTLVKNQKFKIRQEGKGKTQPGIFYAV